MFARFIAISALLLQIVAVLGEPVPFPAPTAAPEVANVRRDFFDDIISDAHDAFSSFTDDAAERVHSFVTSVGEQGVTLISEHGGSVYTLARDGVGSVTSIAGSEYTVATDGFAQWTSTALPGAGFARSPISSSLVYSLSAMVLSVMMGAAYVL